MLLWVKPFILWQNNTTVVQSTLSHTTIVSDLGRLDYKTTWKKQLELLSDCQKTKQEYLLMVEHPPVITLGRRRDSLSNVLNDDNIDVVSVERGGDVTYHGFGQLVVYPILYLREDERDLHRYMRNLEQAIIDVLMCYDINGVRISGQTGVWVEDRKIASIGIACRRWVTFHGLALNVTTDLTSFLKINPCGFDASVMTSMSNESSQDQIDIERIKPQMLQTLGHVLKRKFI